MRSDVTVAMLLAVVTACTSPPPPNGPEPAAAGPQDTILKPASLVRRLAEAADGYRDGELRFVVAAREFPHEVAGVFLSKEAADSAAAASSTDALHFAVFGPYRTPPEAGVSPEVDDVDYVVAHLKNGDTVRYDGDEYDALFWSLPAFDKFVAPYLTSVSGAAHADSMRKAYKQGELTNSALGHKRASL